MKIGLFGGTFNPYHNGHLKIADYVKNFFKLDRIFLIPSATPPHKPNHELISAAIRFEMVEKSINNISGFYVSDKELTRTGPSFTVDTVEAFQKDFPKDTRFFLLMGSDAFMDINTWKHHEKILASIPIIVMIRGKADAPDNIASFIDGQVSKGYTFNSGTCTFNHEIKQDIIICRVPKIDISSTMIRHRVKHHQSIKGLVPEPVEQMIKAKELYQ